MQQSLATGSIIHKRTALTKPSLIALIEKPDTVKRHAGSAVQPRIMSENMEEKFINAQSIITVEQWFKHSGIFVPSATDFSKSFG